MVSLSMFSVTMPSTGFTVRHRVFFEVAIVSCQKIQRASKIWHD